jgi:hypothetical protein
VRKLPAADSSAPSDASLLPAAQETNWIAIMESNSCILKPKDPFLLGTSFAVIDPLLHWQVIRDVLYIS